MSMSKVQGRENKHKSRPNLQQAASRRVYKYMYMFKSYKQPHILKAAATLDTTTNKAFQHQVLLHMQTLRTL